MFDYKIADNNDADYLAASLVKLCAYIKEHGSDLYSKQLPSAMNDDLQAYAKEHIDVEQSFAFLCQHETTPIACCYGKIQASQLPVCYKKLVGFISVCWVEEAFARQGIGQHLLQMVEEHLKEQDIHVIELSYMCCNQTAASFWSKHGFAGFRTFAHKEI